MSGFLRLLKSLPWYRMMMAGFLLYFLFTLVTQRDTLNEISDRKEAAEERLSAAQKENEALRAERAKLEDRVYIEKIAREDLGLTRKGEMPYTTRQK